VPELDFEAIATFLQSVDPRTYDTEALAGLVRATAMLRSTVTALHLGAVGEFDVRNGFVADGQTDIRAWLTHYTGVSRPAAGSQSFLARRLRRLPLVAAALLAGRITECQVRTVVRCGNPRTQDALARDEAEFVEWAETFSHRDFERLAHAWLQVNDPDGARPRPGPRSHVSLSDTFQDWTRIDGGFDPADGIPFRTEARRLADQIFHEDQAADPFDPHKTRTPAERMAAALVRMAERSAALRDRDGRDQDATIRPRRADIAVTVDLDVLEAALRDDRQPSLDRLLRPARLPDGTPLPAWLLAQWACDSQLGRILMNGDSLPLDVGRAFRTATPAQRRALIARDRGCIVPGCDCPPIWTDAHHVQPWEHDGPTNLDNLVLVCRRHHTQIHRRQLELKADPATRRWRAYRPNGIPIETRPPPTSAAA